MTWSGSPRRLTVPSGLSPFARRNRLALALLLAAAACGGDGSSDEDVVTASSDVVGETPIQGGSDGGTTVSDDGGTGPDDGGTGPEGGNAGSGGGVDGLEGGTDAVDILLAQSYATTEVGDGIGTDCTAEQTTEPSIVLKDIYFNNPPQLGAIVALCLFGFSSDGSIDVTTSAASGETFTTRFVPADGERSYLYPGSTCESNGPSCGPPQESRNRLFEPAERPIYSDGAGGLITNDWWYIPHLADSLVETGSFQIDAVQGDVTTSTNVAVAPATAAMGTAYWLEDASDSSALYTVVGFEQGQRVPIGLYASRSNADTVCPGPFDLVAGIGTFVVPASGVTVLRIPDSAFSQAADGFFVLTPPVLDLRSAPVIVNGQRGSSCALDGSQPVDDAGLEGATTTSTLMATTTDIGESPRSSESIDDSATEPLSLGDRGARVERLQEALVEFGYLEPADVDGIFGEGSESAVVAFQIDLGLEVDGIAGPATYEALGLSYE